MIEIIKTEQYSQWLDNLFDTKVRARIQARIERLAWGNPGDAKSVGEKVFEMRGRFWARLSYLLHKKRHETSYLINRRQ